MIKNSNKKLLAALALGLSTSCSLQNSKSHFKEGADISHHQGDIKWGELTPENSGKTFIIAKATEGKTWQDPRFLDNFRNICANGFQAGAYHRLRFGTGSTPEEQADNLFNQLRLADNEWATKNQLYR